MNKEQKETEQIAIDKDLYTLLKGGFTLEEAKYIQRRANRLDERTFSHTVFDEQSFFHVNKV